MNLKYYKVVLTDGYIRDAYDVQAKNKREAIIKAQFYAIENCHGHEVVSCREINY